jgi:hypothetical protein
MAAAVVVVVVVVEMAMVVFAWGLCGQGRSLHVEEGGGGGAVGKHPVLHFERGGMVVWLGNIPHHLAF